MGLLKIVDGCSRFGEPWLFYKAFPINVSGTTADHNGNISMEKEALTLDNLALATAAKNCKGPKRKRSVES